MFSVDKEYLDADFEVIGMVNRGHGTGGELPGKAVHFIPEGKRTQAVIELDKRIAVIEKYGPGVMFVLGIVAAFAAGAAL